MTVPFWVSAWVKASDLNKAICEIATLGLPFPRATTAAVIGLQASASALIITGYLVWPSAFALIAFTGLASLQAHRFWEHDGILRTTNFNAFMANIGLIGGLLLGAVVRSTP
ncbi:DoxX family protein [Parasedimentitalea marina]|uniref:DoxX family protein n=1 Tax=Parasedimentitalea marina TaxID=2483033 RepID=UPI0013E2D93B|nr:DoxX family protein [Parasedimentitalea marina]